MLALSYSSGDEKLINIWHTTNGSLMTQYKDNACLPQCLEATGDFLLGLQMVERHGQHGFRQTFHVWNYEQLKFFTPIDEPSQPLSCIALSLSGQFCAGGGSKGNVYLWEVATGHLLRIVHAHQGPVNTIKFSEDGVFLVSGGDDATLRIYRLERILAAAAQERIQASSAEVLATTAAQVEEEGGHVLPAHAQPITALAVASIGGGGAWAFSGSLDRSVKVPDPASQHPHLHPAPGTVTSSIWDCTTGRLLHSVTLPNPVTALCVAASMETMYAGTATGTIHVTPLTRARMDVTGLTVDPSDQQLVSASRDGTCRVWAQGQCVRTVVLHNHSPSSAPQAMVPLWSHYVPLWSHYGPTMAPLWSMPS
ncbi:hypothetical protein PAPYR_2042 [Paratrimastix pyriformis]|uniref:Uncharacterized protein n=1 Tax=Paratrimastix pyriformis TaxID=342808 RepID=A0ABQ8UQP7_9EUKA|nr:hypothetical protein PAPYR_2042 [Paratrimastix pyriformis]